MALSRFGLNWNEFLDLTPYELYHAVKDKEEYDTEKIQSIVRLVCETIRIHALYTINIQLPRNKKIRNGRNLWAFSWERGSTVEPQTIDEMGMTMKLIASSYKKSKWSVAERRETMMTEVRRKKRNAKKKKQQIDGH